MTDAALRAWRLILVLGPVLVVALAFQSIWTLRDDESRPDPADMSVEAGRVAQLADAYIRRMVGVTSHLAVAPEVVSLAKASTARSITGRDDEIESRWASAVNVVNDPFIPIRDQPVSRYFVDVRAADSAYREIFLSDMNGRLIAASNRTEDFQQKDDLWWPKDKDLKMVTAACRRLPMTCVHLSGIKWDPSAGVFGYAVVLPVVDTDGGKVKIVGILKAVVDPKELDTLLQFAALNPGLDVTLLDADGVRVFSRKPFFPPKDEKKDKDGKKETAKTEQPRLGELKPGNEGSWPLSGTRQDGKTVFVRRLESPVAGGWFIAVTERDQGRDGLWRSYVLWCLLTLGMFLVAAGAFAVRGKAA
jgi:hypothetical protein